jgi:hypothetical protein|tara:strand:+ start:116 stop:688 length:573 start_codon:yes stop_codon:yes gene_type:complete
MGHFDKLQATTLEANKVKAFGTNHALGCKKFVSFTGSLANITNAEAYADGDCLVELGQLDMNIPGSHVAASKFIVDKAIINVTTVAGTTLVGTLNVSATSGTAPNAALTSGTEIVGAGVTYYDGQVAADLSVTEVDINLNSAGVQLHTPFQDFDASKDFLYLCTTTTLSTSNAATAQACRFTVHLEYTVI